MGIFPFFSLHPSLAINILIAALLGFALYLTKEPLILLGLAFLLFHSSQQVMMQGEPTEAAGEFDEDEPSMGFTARLKE